MVTPVKKGGTHSWGDKIAAAKRGKPRHDMRGEKHFRWKGGKFAGFNIELKEWRDLCLERDDYQCRNCGIEARKLEVHHIEDWHARSDLRYDVDNGIVLCTSCHVKGHGFGGDRRSSEYRKWRREHAFY